MGFDPVSLSMAAAAAGSVTKAFGSWQAGEAGAQASNFQAQVAENNAAAARQNFTWEMQAGQQRATDSEMKTRAQVGETKTGQAAAGIDVNTGSAAAVQSAEGKLGELDALTIRSNSARRAYGYEVAATSDEAQAQLDRAQASQSRISGDIGAATSLLSGASSAGGKYAMYQLGQPTANPVATYNQSGPDMEGGIWPA